MSPALHEFVSIDLPAMSAAVLASAVCALLGSFLVLRRQSLVGDAISHAVLPGLVVGFLLSGSRAAAPMFLGAGVAALIAVALIGAVRRFGRVEPGAAMGVVFSIMFALGVVLLEQAAARQVDLDADCVLHGQLETIFWLPPATWAEFWSWGTLREVPRQVVVLGATFVACAALVGAFFKELRIVTFDPGLASSLGLRSGWVQAGLMAMVAAATVASFEAVGSILVIAMLICPAATARMLTDRLMSQVLVSVAVGVGSGVVGYLLAAHAAPRLGLPGAVNAAGSITVVSGALLVGACLGAPRHGVAARALRRARLGARIAREDALAALYRLEERSTGATQNAVAALVGPGVNAARALRLAVGAGLAEKRGAAIRLTSRGRDEARRIVRSHRLWESYLVEEVGLKPDHVHDTAMRLEHLGDERDRIMPRSDRSADPHDRPIPPPS
ncbi:MAG: metal ABC transporter permease [Phycisphaerales bacterium]|nr:metal ABC transporter permease [Phycisphaerales bacterium]